MFHCAEEETLLKCMFQQDNDPKHEQKSSILVSDQQVEPYGAATLIP